jgi:hypothetical protein
VHGFEKGRVSVSNIEGRVGAEHIKVAIAFDIIDPDPFSFGEYDRQRLVVMGSELGFLLDE